jgi:hypothetical protein
MNQFAGPEGIDAEQRSLVDAMAAEGEALEMVLTRARSVLLLQTAAQFDHLDRAVRDLDVASAALSTVSLSRERAVAAVIGEVSNRAELIERCPAPIRDIVTLHLDSQRKTLAEVVEVNAAITRGARVAMETLQRRRQELERVASGRVTYGPR